MKKWILNIHMYLGLSCAGYMVTYGLSTIGFNHHCAWMSPSESRTTWSAMLSAPVATSDQKLAEALRDSLGLIGWIPAWEIHRPSECTLDFVITRRIRSPHGG